jgi:hypothetical protein
VFRYFISKNQNVLRKILIEILNTLSPLAGDGNIFSKAFIHLWTSNPFLKNIMGLLIRLTFIFDQMLDDKTNYTFAEGFAYGFSREIARMIEHELSLIFLVSDFRIFSISWDFTKDFIGEFGEEFCKKFGEGFGDGFNVSKSVFGRAFCGRTFEPPHRNNNQIPDTLGGGLFNKGYTNSHGRDFDAHDTIYDMLDKILFVNLSRISCINLLSNDNWAWVLWCSIRSNLSINTFLHNTENYFKLLPDYEHGYHFDKCKNLSDLLLADQLVCPMTNLSSQLYDKFPFLWNLRWTKLELRGHIFYVNISRVDDKEATPIVASNDVIQKWWKEIDWDLCLGFESYSQLLVPHTDKLLYHIINKDEDIAVPRWVLILVLPTDVDGKPRRKYITETENIEEAVAGIIGCEQASNIIDYIYLYHTQKDASCSYEKIKMEYERFIRDYVTAIRS